MNLYIYVQNNPINFVDPSGLREIVANAINLLKKSKSANDIVPVLEKLNKEGKIVFGEVAERALAQYEPAKDLITIKVGRQNDRIADIASTLAHEGQHKLDLGSGKEFRYASPLITSIVAEENAFTRQAKVLPEIIERKDFNPAQRVIVENYEKRTLLRFVIHNKLYRQ